MNQIKFDQYYDKFGDQKTATLLHVSIVRKDQLTNDLIEYETETTHDDGYNSLPNGLLLILVFLGDRYIPFTTIRKASAAKQRRYESQIGQNFEIVIKPEDIDALPIFAGASTVD